MPSKKWVFIINVCLSFIMSVVLSICLTVGQGFHLSLMGFLYTFAFAFGTSIVVSFFVPLPRIGAWFARQMGSDPDGGSGMFYLIDSAVQVTFFLIIVNLVMTIALSGIGYIGELSWFDRWWIMNMNFWAVALVAFLIVRTLSTAIANKLADPFSASTKEEEKGQAYRSVQN